MDKKNHLSKIISFLRFPLCVLVIIQHSNLVFGIKSQGNDLYIADLLSKYVITYFSHILSHSAVPLFFFISGFLFTFNMECYNCECYKKKLKNRIKTILLPYILWSLIAILYVIIKHQPFMSSIFPQYLGDTINYGDFIKQIWVVDRGDNYFADVPQTPIDGPLWFIRDLFVMVLLVPVFMKLGKFLKYLLVTLFMLIWVFHLTPPFLFPGFSTMGGAFFFLGIIWGENKALLPKAFAKIAKYNIVVYILLTIINLSTVAFVQLEQSVYIQHIIPIQNLNIISGIILVLSISYVLTKYKCSSVIIDLSSSTFFIFAFHNLVNGNILSLILRTNVFNAYSTTGVLSTYFIYVLSTIVISLLAYAVTNKIPILNKYLALKK